MSQFDPHHGGGMSEAVQEQEKRAIYARNSAMLGASINEAVQTTADGAVPDRSISIHLLPVENGYTISVSTNWRHRVLVATSIFEAVEIIHRVANDHVR